MPTDQTGRDQSLPETTRKDPDAAVRSAVLGKGPRREAAADERKRVELMALAGSGLWCVWALVAPDSSKFLPPSAGLGPYGNNFQIEPPSEKVRWCTAPALRCAALHLHLHLLPATCYLPSVHVPTTYGLSARVSHLTSQRARHLTIGEGHTQVRRASQRPEKESTLVSQPNSVAPLVQPLFFCFFFISFLGSQFPLPLPWGTTTGSLG